MRISCTRVCIYTMYSHTQKHRLPWRQHTVVQKHDVEEAYISRELSIDTEETRRGSRGVEEERAWEQEGEWEGGRMWGSG